MAPKSKAANKEIKFLKINNKQRTEIWQKFSELVKTRIVATPFLGTADVAHKLVETLKIVEQKNSLNQRVS